MMPRHCCSRCAWCWTVACDYRRTFGKDVVIDLVCYRRHGHNEADEPMMTQPFMYRRIRAMETARALYAARLERDGAEAACAWLAEQGIDGAAAMQTAERIRQAIATHRFPHGETQPGGRLTISGGVAEFSEEGADRLLQRADGGFLAYLAFPGAAAATVTARSSNRWTRSACDCIRD